MLYRFVLIFILISEFSFGQVSQLSYKEHCASDDEERLHSLINEYRISHQLEPVEFSLCLSYVARTHAIDLKNYRPDFGGCNLHSWSDKGIWTPCCYAKDEKRLACMTQKPREFTPYKFKAYEVVYSATEGSSSEDAFEFWKGISLMNDYLLNTGKWEKPWLSLGVGIYEEYICVWFGEGKDPEGIVKVCSDIINVQKDFVDEKQAENIPGTDSIVTQSTFEKVGIAAHKIEEGNSEEEGVAENLIDTLMQNAPELINKQEDDSSQYFIIVATTSTVEQASAEVKKLKGLGNSNAKYLPTATFYRIAINKYKEESIAFKALAEIRVMYPDAWLLKPVKKNN